MPSHKVFLSYSHKDEVWKNRLATHLSVLEGEGLLQTWDDRQIRAGSNWEREIEAAMQEARVAVLLISADFLSSDFIRGREVPAFLERRNRDGLHVVPVIVRDCVWKNVPCLSGLQVLPGKPLNKFTPAQRDTEIRKIAEEILALLQGDQQPPPPLPSTFRPLHQLPPPPLDFTGRAAELAELRAAIEAGGATLSGVRGLGGIGKTALALKLAEELSPLFPDAQIYLDLRGVSPAPLRPADAMAHVVRSFQPEARLPEDEATLAGLYRSVLHGQRALLLMDNAADAAQVQPLVPPKGCVLLVTSRARFTLPGLLSKDLDELPPDDARALLLSIAPRIGSEADSIENLCAGLPLALRLAASTLAERPDLSPGGYAQRLATEQGRLGLIEGSLSLSVDLLSEDLARAWVALAVFPVTFDAEAAAAVWELEAAATDATLGDLVKRSLIEGEDGRYRLHDLARVFAAHRLLEPERSAVQWRHAAHYKKILARADDLYLAGGKGILAGLRLFDEEWANIQAGQAWAVVYAEGDQEAARLVGSYSDAGAYCLDLRLRPMERIRWFEEGLKAFRALGDRQGEAGALGSLGIAYTNLSEVQRAIELYEQCLAIAREIGDRQYEGRALGGLGIAYTNLSEVQRAIALYDQWLAIAHEIGDRRSEGQALGNLGVSYADLGETQRACECYEQCISIAREIGDREGEGIASWNLGLVFEQAGDFARAIQLMQSLVDFEREIGHSDAEEDAARVEAILARRASEGDGHPSG